MCSAVRLLHPDWPRPFERLCGCFKICATYDFCHNASGSTAVCNKPCLMQIRRGCERNVITYSSLISACEKAGRWELALDLFGEMHREGCKPNVVTYNSLIAACAQGILSLVYHAAEHVQAICCCHLSVLQKFKCAHPYCQQYTLEQINNESLATGCGNCMRSNVLIALFHLISA